MAIYKEPFVNPETCVAKSLLSETLREVEHLALEIARAQAILDALNAKRDEAVARADRFRAAIVPHKRVPQEVLAEIFAHTVEGMPFTLYFLNVPRLETFSLECDADDIEDPDPDDYKLFEDYLLSTDVFCNAESLRKLRMRHFALFECLEDAPFPWDQLTDLDLSLMEMTTASVVNILKQCTRLVGCSLRTTSPLWHTTMQNQMVLPYLQSMTWVRYDHLDDHILEYLLPLSLRELRIASYFTTGVSSLIQNSRSTLEIFRFESPSVDWEVPLHLEDVLSEMSALVEFETSLKISPSTLEKVSSMTLLPCLEVLKCGVSLDSVDSFIAAIENWLQDETTLQAKLSQVTGLLASAIPESAARHVVRIQDQYGIDFQFQRGSAWHNSPFFRRRIVL
ncbi:hypothetical protein Hypma_002932 [Hypsizygus marmoreus]|uniref:F-box domain-containing protein n=1 Tax=Hypsizygus marmoreus TaxID=39966 RepID=A0A369J3E8_HYPMA|nr:hypothetical protein Hypma_002932 [Hypsizygus marmoreus]